MSKDNFGACLSTIIESIIKMYLLIKLFARKVAKYVMPKNCFLLYCELLLSETRHHDTFSTGSKTGTDVLRSLHGLRPILSTRFNQICHNMFQLIRHTEMQRSIRRLEVEQFKLVRVFLANRMIRQRKRCHKCWT